MKKIFLLAIGLTIYSFAFAQEMEGMKMPKKEKSKKPAANKKLQTATDPSTKKEGVMQMPGDTAKNNKMDGMDMPKTRAEKSDDMGDMNMSKTTAVKRIGKRVAYTLNVTDTLVTFAKGKIKPAIAINGTIPAPTLYFTEGDTAVINVHNGMKVETSIHWHGLLLPNEADGVPYLTTPPIKSGVTYTFSFPVIQNGTYWYHSHTGLQEQVGLYGGIVIYPNNAVAQKEKLILFSDWTNEKMATVVRSLKAGYEWYGMKRNSVQSWGEALVKGYLGDKAKQEWGRMPPMDVSDVYYHAFLANGKQSTEYPEFMPGETIRLRLINGAAGSYFYIQFAGGPMTVVAADGIDVKPVIVDKIDFPIAETYDVLITIPAEGAYELRATAADISGYSSVYFGSGKKVAAPNIPALDYFAMLRERNKMEMDGSGKKGASMESMDMGASDKKSSTMPGMDMKKKEDVATKMDGMDMSAKKETKEKSDMAGMKMDNGKSAGTLTYDMLRSLQPTAFDEKLPVRIVPLTLTGNMIRYIWSFDDKPLSKSDNILVKKGEVVRFKMFNNTMMRHPMHLHGHFFRLINAQGDYSPLKHTFDIQPMETVTIEFLANEEKDWFFHCHILYHLVAGMARVVSYEGSEQNEFAKTGYKELKKEDNAVYKWADLNVLSNGVFLESFASNNKNQLRFEGRANWKGGFETETHLLRFLDKEDYLAAFIGYDYRKNKEELPTIPNSKEKPNTKDNRRQFEAGLIYLLPFFVEAEGRVDPTGKFRAQLQRRDMPITTRLFFDGKINTDKEYLVGLRYFISRTFSISTLYDSDYGVGAGISIRY